MTSFYMRATLALNGLKNFKLADLLKAKYYELKFPIKIFGNVTLLLSTKVNNINLGS